MSALGRAVEVREARVTDAAALCRYKRQVLVETEFLLQGREDWQDDVAGERHVIEAFAHHPRSVLLLAVERSARGAEIVGMCSVVGGPYLRNAHVGQLGMGVRRSHWRRGVGKALLQAALSWAALPGHLSKISLQVHEANLPARRLYEACGFVVEGRLRGEALLGGAPADLLAMGWFVAGSGLDHPPRAA